MVYISKREAIGSIEWKVYHDPPCPESLPNGQWGINKDGDYYLCDFDEVNSYYYFNNDGSWYFREGQMDPEARAAATYMSPKGDKIYRPSTSAQSQEDSLYLTGIDWQTGSKRVYWDGGDGKLVRTFRKDFDDDDLKELEEFTIRKLWGSSGNQLIFVVALDGTYNGDDPEILRAMKKEIKREERTPRRTPLHTQRDSLPISPEQSRCSKKTGFWSKQAACQS